MANWIKGAIKHPGALHRELGVPQGQKIPAKKLKKPASAGGRLGRRARLAETLKGFHHGTQDESHTDARRQPHELHAGLMHDALDGETTEQLHHNAGDHTAGQIDPVAKWRHDGRRGDASHDSPAFRAPSNPHGNPGYHPSVSNFEHEGYMHTSKHR